MSERLTHELEAIARDIGECHALVLELAERARSLGETIDGLAADAAYAATLRAERDRPADPRLDQELTR